MGSWQNYKYNGKELQSSGMYDYGARFYMPDIGIFGQHDPLSEKTMQPYAYVYNNPIKYIDPMGMIAEGIDPTEFNKNADNRSKLAMREFVNTREGYNFFSKYAKAGDEIGGVKFLKDGEYHKQGIDINVGTNVTVDGASGTVSNHMNENRLVFNLDIKNGRSYIGGAIETIAHESFIHILPQTKDYLDNKKFDFSAGFDKEAISFLKANYKNIDGNHNGYGWIDHFSEFSSGNARDKYIAPILNQYYQKINKNVSQKELLNNIHYFRLGADLSDKAIKYMHKRQGK